MTKLTVVIFDQWRINLKCMKIKFSFDIITLV